MGPVGSQGGSGSEGVTPFFKKRGPKWIPPGGPGKNRGAQKSNFGKKAVRAQRFFFDFCEKTAKTAKR
jgi:hypothetical protein